MIRDHIVKIALVAEGKECRSGIFSTEPHHNSCFLTGGDRIPEGLGILLCWVNIVREAHHGDFLSLRQTRILFYNLIQTLRVGILVSLPGSMTIEIYLCFRRCTNFHTRQQGKHRRAVHGSIGIRIVGIMEIHIGIGFMVVDGLIHIGNHGSLACIAEFMQYIHIQARLLAPLQKYLRIKSGRHLLRKICFVGEDYAICQLTVI